jgi:hypothetical protein
MGVFGALLYFAALVVGLVSTVTRLAAVYRSRNEAAAAVAATCVAVQVALIGAELSGDHHSSLMGILFWLVVGVSSTLRERLNEVRSPVGFQHRNRPARA